MYKPYHNTTLQFPLPILLPPENEGEDEAQLRVCVVRFFLDQSFSMLPHENSVYEAVHNTLKALAEKNRTALDVKFRVQIILFNDKVTELNAVPLPPEQLAEVFNREIYRVNGGTNISAMVEYNDKSYSRTSALLSQRKKGDYKILDVSVTDFHGTDSADERKAALSSVKRNRLASQAGSHLCVFVGTEEDKHEAIELAGSADNIVALSSDLSRHLTPILIHGTISLADATHINDDDADQTPAEIGKAEKEREQEGRDTATQLSGKQLSDKLSYLLGMK